MNKEGVNGIMGKFVIKEVSTGTVFRLEAANGETIATSEVYASLDACKKGIESVRVNALVHVEDQTAQGYEKLTHPKYELYQDKAEEYRFRLKASNGQVVAVSQGYSRKESCKNGIASVGKNAPDAPVVTEEKE